MAGRVVQLDKNASSNGLGALTQLPLTIKNPLHGKCKRSLL
jgi:hypothetical protein